MRRLAALVLLLGACRPATSDVPRRTFRDARGKDVAVPYPPKRIVSLTPGTTELLFAAGAGPQVAGVTTWCTYPPEAASRPAIGDVVVSAEKIAAIDPDLVVTTARLTRQAAEDLERAGRAVYSVDPTTFEGIADALRRLGELTGRAEEGARAAEALTARVAAVKAAPGPTVYLEYGADPIGTTGPETPAGDALRRAGGRNVFDGGWRTVPWESVLARDPEVVFIVHEATSDLERRVGWKGLRAVKSGRVHVLKKDHWVYPTPRLVEGLEEAARLLHAKTP